LFEKQQLVLFCTDEHRIYSKKESLGRNVERMTREELKDIIRKIIDKAKKQHVTPEVI
jgi:spore coat polysaccharide biosynthesis protein SpsF (cytidylyltransferase family)